MRIDTRHWLFPLGGLAIWSGAVALMFWLGPDFGFRKHAARRRPPADSAAGARPTDFLVKVGQVDLPARYKHLLYDRPYLYVSLGLDGLAVLDCADPARPRVLARWQGEEHCHPLQIAAGKNCFYIADRFRGILVARLDGDSPPEILTTLSVPAPGIATALEVRQSRLIASCGAAGAMIFDLADPLQPVLLHHYSERIDYTTGAVIAGDALYLADGFSGGFKILRVEPAGIKFQKLIHTPSYCDEVLAVRDRVYTKNREDGFLIYDISTDPLNPVLINRIHRSGDAITDFDLRDGLLLVTYKFFGIAAWDVRVERQPRLLAAFRIGEKTETFCRVDNYVYVGNDAQGISVFAMNLAQFH